MCSVRHKPIPSAPRATAWAASFGVSALAQTPSLRAPSAQLSNSLASARLSRLGCTVSNAPKKTLPLEPSMLMSSPSRTVKPSAVTVSRSRSTCNASHPTIQGLPSPRVTTAAWLVTPPRLVTTPGRRCDAVDILGLGLRPNQDDVHAPALRRRRPGWRQDTPFRWLLPARPRIPEPPEWRLHSPTPRPL